MHSSHVPVLQCLYLWLPSDSGLPVGGVWEFGNAEPGSGSGRALFPVFTVRTISGIRIWISSDSTTHGIDIGSTYLEPRYCRTLNYLIRSLLLM